MTEEEASRHVYQNRESPRKRFPCPREQCQARGVMVQQLGRHLRQVHRADRDDLPVPEEADREPEVAAGGVEEGEEQTGEFLPGDGVGDQDLWELEAATGAEEGGAGGGEEGEEEQTGESLPADGVGDQDFAGAEEGGAVAAGGGEEGEEEQTGEEEQSLPGDGLGDEEVLNAFGDNLQSIDGGDHPGRMARQYRDMVGRMARASGGLRNVVANPTHMTREGGYVSWLLDNRAATTVKVYIWALLSFLRFAVCTKFMDFGVLQGCKAQAESWQRSLRKRVQERKQELRLRDEARVEAMLEREGDQETPRGSAAREYLLKGDFDRAVYKNYTESRHFLMQLVLGKNAQRSGAVLKMKWTDVNAAVAEGNHTVIRTFNKTKRSHGLTSLTLNNEERRMLVNYKELQCKTLGPDVQHVFATARDNPVQSGQMSLSVQKMTGTRASATLLRKKSVVASKKAKSDMGALAQHMRHSKRTQERDYMTFHDRQNAVEVYEDLETVEAKRRGKKRFKSTKAAWTGEMVEVLRNAYADQISYGGISRSSVKSVMELRPEVREMGVSAEQIRSKLRLLHDQQKKA